jgi:hypothetical protein
MSKKKNKHTTGRDLTDVRDQGIHENFSSFHEHSLHKIDLEDTESPTDHSQDNSRGSSSGEEKDITD